VTDRNSYKDPLYVRTWLDTALEKEWRKYSEMPVTPDMIPGHEAAQGWGYVVAGYFLIEQGLKAVLYVRGIDPPRIHALSVLFGELPTDDQEALRTYYDDFRHSLRGMSSFPLATLNEFLVNLDGGRNDQGRYIGSFDWRYFLTEEGSGAPMPLVSVNFMHEVAYGCVRLVESIATEGRNAAECTYSWRLYWQRSELHHDWLMVRMNSPGWGQEGDRLEILWGPGYRDRYDYLVFKGDQIRSFCAPLPNAEDVQLPMIDKRDELEAFDPEVAFQSIGVTVGRTVRRRETASRHLMY
jgi:hypothetical protein